MSKAPFMLSANDLYQYHYCPRKIYYIKMLGLRAEKRKMSQGREEQDKEKKRLAERKEIFGIKREYVKKIMYDVYLENEEIGLCGIVDILLVLYDGGHIPVEIKYTDLPEVTYGRRRQLAAYALLIDNSFRTNTRNGILYFTEQNREVFVKFTNEDKEGVLADLERIRKLIRDEKLPRKANSRRCSYCEYLKICRG
ncbi:MAG: CRISPR-associated protein Cas4 [Candidatus Methanomethylicota archaeon]|uniref:CRISPR-associated exonuclease Cas4 n=1 Tax=Thermoproteota archaeon TaxID=2056631 RepID=A0A523BF02_9CREN|nr:MAG: CRISPR-associated protein Cas4 [Candidatus Verstraetearchaeota archaeon]